jgi:hypothetical protein
VWGVEDMAAYGDRLNNVHFYDANVWASDLVASARFIWNSTDPNLSACGVYFRRRDEDTYYITLVRKDGGALLWLRVNQAWGPTLAEFFVAGVHPRNGEVNEMVLVAQQDAITLFVNGSVAYEAHDSTLVSGAVGLVTGTGNTPNTCTFTQAWIWDSD